MPKNDFLVKIKENGFVWWILEIWDSNGEKSNSTSFRNLYIQTGTYPSISINHQSHQPPQDLPLSDREVGDLSHLLHGRQGDASQTRIHRIGMDRLPPWGLPSERLERITTLKINVSLERRHFKRKLHLPVIDFVLAFRRVHQWEIEILEWKAVLALKRISTWKT